MIKKHKSVFLNWENEVLYGKERKKIKKEKRQKRRIF